LGQGPKSMNKLLSTLERIANAAEQVARHLGAALGAASPPRPPGGPSLAQGADQPANAPGTSPELRAIADGIGRLADALAPQPDSIVGTPHVARRLGCSTVWVAELARQGRIPKGCLVPGTGNGKPWKFYRDRIDDWLKSR
jgi:hypothetical protein